ncbi:DUF6252 family protein [Subsaxibacter sp. CAU 1640]|uniref:DUF6252 family protein n=1 Tax=Subsaxibacter sp. CAU 1640 TaxID=2933271 RepID=UPI0020051AAC|nr:DUF6252 family protein [Subsaxibacter sp. CAU 1640]MCK7591530.1 DUF6252 family protein [Subsaxibacter sp. CAU 1640]
MKNLRKFMLLVMTVAMVSVSSCSKDDDGGSAGPAAQGTIVAKVNGTSVTTLEMVTFANISSGTLTMQGNTGGTSSKAFVFTIIGYDGEGTYELGGGPNIFNTASYQETEVDLANPTAPEIQIWQAPFDDTVAGEINISEETETHVIGTFSFQAKDVNGDQSMRNITEGSFNIEKMQ